MPAEKRAKILWTLLSMEIWYKKVYQMMGSAQLEGKKIAVMENGLFSTYTMREGLMLHLLKEGCEVYILTHANRFLPQVEKMGLKVIDVGSGNLNPVKVSRYIYNLQKGIKKN